MSHSLTRRRVLTTLGLFVLSLTVIVGVGTHAGDSKPAKKEPAPGPAAAAKPAKPAAPVNPLEAVLQYVQQQRESRARQQAQENLRQIGLALKKYEAAGAGPKVPPGPGAAYFYLLPYIGNNAASALWEASLGARPEPVSDALASHLALPKGQGQVLGKPTPGGPAAKAGLKQHDILLQLGGKPVPRDAMAFEQLLAILKPGTPLVATVLRQGKRIEVKGLTLAKNDTASAIYYHSPFMSPSSKLPPGSSHADGTSNTIIFGEKGAGTGLGWGGEAGKPVLSSNLSINLYREGRFTTRLDEGPLILTVTGTVKDGKARVAGIQVQDGIAINRYAALEKVPAKYRDKVAQIVERSASKANTGK